MTLRDCVSSVVRAETLRAILACSMFYMQFIFYMQSSLACVFYSWGTAYCSQVRALDTCASERFEQTFASVSCADLYPVLLLLDYHIV